MPTELSTFRGATSAVLTLRRLRDLAQRPVSAVAKLLEAHPTLAVLAILLIYVPQVFAASRAKPMWHDELYTFYIAQSPSLADMWHLIRDVDLNPPLGYLLTRLSFRLLGVNTLATRLPEMLAFLAALLALFEVARRRLGVSFGLFAAMVVMESDIQQLAMDARPYGLMFCFFMLALLAWQSLLVPVYAPVKTDRWRRAALHVLLFLSLLALLLSHAFGLPLTLILLAAQAWATAKTRHLDRSIWLSMLLPLLAAGLYAPLLRNHGGAMYPQSFQPDGDTIFAFYIHSIDREIIALCLTAVLVLLLFGPAHLRGPGVGRWFLRPAEWIVVIGLMLLPLLLMARLILGHGAFFPRYGAMDTWAVALLSAVLLARWTSIAGRPDPRPAVLGTLVLYLMSGYFVDIPHAIASGTLLPTIRNAEPAVPACDACRRTAAIDPSIPLVDASGLTFVEMNHNESAETLRRVFYLTDPAGSLEYAHANIFEHMPEVVRLFHLRGHSEPLAAFRDAHPHFFVFGDYDYPEDWLLRKLSADGATIRVVARTSGDAYRDNELYEVWLRNVPPPGP